MGLFLKVATGGLPPLKKVLCKSVQCIDQMERGELSYCLQMLTEYSKALGVTRLRILLNLILKLAGSFLSNHTTMPLIAHSYVVSLSR
jgi:hypothetical protein